MRPPPTSCARRRSAPKAGLRYVYAGNLPGQVGGLEDTRCPSCGATVIARRGFRVTEPPLDDAGRCSACGAPIAGYWGP